jgi:hypothetical protein
MNFKDMEYQFDNNTVILKFSRTFFSYFEWFLYNY